MKMIIIVLHGQGLIIEAIAEANKSLFRKNSGKNIFSVVGAKIKHLAKGGKAVFLATDQEFLKHIQATSML